MESRELGRSGLEVSGVGLGCMGMSEFYGASDDAASMAVLHHAIDIGVTFWDTADMSAALGVRPREQERTREGPLPQVFADMFGWEDLVQRVARVYHALPPEERARCGIFTQNDGRAGAIDFFGPRYCLPPANSMHNNYWLWGPRGHTGDVLIIVGGDRDDPNSDFASVTLADTTSCEYCMPYENGAPTFVCRGLNQPLARRWREIRHYN